MNSRRTPDPPPVVIDGFEVLDKIGDGGFSVVYRARQQSMNREVAVKVLNIGFATDTERATFRRECHALGQLSHHPNIVTVFNETITRDGRPCIVMELYHQTYRQRLDAQGPLHIDEVLSVGVRICGALQTAHDAGVLHRDLKPHNIFVSAYGEPALGDFGISTIDDERSQNAATSGLSVAYAPPEILEDGATDVTSDLYSLAATLYQLASGDTPFASNDLRTTVRKILTEPPPPVNRPGIPTGFDRVMRKALAKNPTDRPQTALELAEMFRELQARAGLDRTPIPRLTVTRPTTVEPSPRDMAIDGADEAPSPSADVFAAATWPPPSIEEPMGGGPAFGGGGDDRSIEELLRGGPGLGGGDDDDRMAGSETPTYATIARRPRRSRVDGRPDRHGHGRAGRAQPAHGDDRRGRRPAIVAAATLVAAVAVLVPGIRMFGTGHGEAAGEAARTTEAADTSATTASPETTAIATTSPRTSAAPTTTAAPATTTTTTTSTTTSTTTTAPPVRDVHVTVPGTVWWTDSGVALRAGDRVDVEASGIVSASVTDPRTYVGPDGSLNPEFTVANRDEAGVKVGGGHAALIGRIGDGPPFLIGASATLHATTPGRLFLSVNDGGLDNNSGEFSVALTAPDRSGRSGRAR